ncbi:hypothetical protein PC123_g8686 [Phytophthora cactorum]|nr:hypothetical protein PC123_g8686 [Phytophthora cactorum]
MWFGVAPPSPARVSRKDPHPPSCMCALHRLERDKELEAPRLHAQQSPRRGGHHAHQSSTSGPLSSRQRENHDNKTMATPRRQMQRPREGTRGERSRDNSDKKQTKAREHDFLQPEHGDGHIGGKANGEELLQLMEGCQIGSAAANGDDIGDSLQQQQYRHPGTLAGGLKASLVLENQGDIGTLPVTPPLTSRTRRSSIHRVTQSPRTDVGRFEEDNNSSREWSTAPSPCASLHPENLVGHVASVCALVAHDDRFIVSCSVDGSVKVWSQVTFECLQTIYGHRDVVSCLDLSARWLVSGSHDNTLRLATTIFTPKLYTQLLRR